MDQEIKPISCIACHETRFSTRSDMQRHVAIVHGEGTFSTLKCERCQKKYYDYGHFTEHIKTSPPCDFDCFMIHPQPLPANLRLAFESLVDQMTRPLAPLTSAPVEGHNNIHAKQSKGRQCIEIEEITLSEDDIDQNSCGAPMKMENSPSLNAPVGHEPQSSTMLDPTTANVKLESLQAPYVADGDSGDTAPTILVPKMESDGVAPAIAVMDADDSPHRQHVAVDHAEGRNNACTPQTESDHISDQESTTGQLDSLFTIYKRIVGNRSSICCNICKKISKPHSESTIDHARFHLNLGLYSCKKCKWTCDVAFAMRNHLRSSHSNDRADASNYENHSDQYRELIIAKLYECFDRKHNAVSDTGGSWAEPASRVSPVAIDAFKTTKRQWSATVFARASAAKRGKLRQVPNNAGPAENQQMECFKAYWRSKVTKRGGGPVIKFGCVQMNQKRTCSQMACERQLHCRLLINASNLPGKVKCNQCPKAITTVSKIGPYSLSAIQHAMMHSKLPIYKCCYCGYNGVAATFSTLISLRYHTVTLHNKTNLIRGISYIDDGDSYHREIMSSLDNCYGKKKANITQLNNFSRHTTCRPQYLKECRRLIRHNARNSGITCKLCQKNITTVSSKGDVKYSTAMQHALIHMNKPAYRCLVCGNSFVNFFHVSKHLVNAHKKEVTKEVTYADCTNQFGDEIVSMLSQCYEYGRRVAQVECKKKRDTSGHRAYLVEILNRHKKSGFISCQKCRKRLSIINRDCIDSRVSLRHMHRHLEKPLFACRFCKETAISASRMDTHIRKCHPTEKVLNGYVDRSNMYEEELRDMIAECYDSGSVSNGESGRNIGIENETGPKIRTSENAATSKFGAAPFVSEIEKCLEESANQVGKIFYCRFPNCGFSTRHVLLGRAHERLMH